MEEDRDGRYELVSRITPEHVWQMLAARRDRREMCFTTGEPTLNENLPRYAAWAKELGYTQIGVISNGRMYSYPARVEALLAAGVNQFIVSIHGHNARLHDGLVRTPGAFVGTTRGLLNLKRFKDRGHHFRVDTSTVVTDRNMPHLREIYALLKAVGVDQVVFNCMQANGRASTHFAQIFPRYRDVARHYRALVDTLGDDPRPPCFLVDIPPCVVSDVVADRRGYVERYLHFQPDGAGDGLARPAGDGLALDGALFEVTRGDLDAARRVKRAECAGCAYDALCEGVWSRYVESYGWEEFTPVAPLTS
jgi:cyclic pyranopterin phosphate synthase